MKSGFKISLNSCGAPVIALKLTTLDLTISLLVELGWDTDS